MITEPGPAIALFSMLAYAIYLHLSMQAKERRWKREADFRRAQSIPAE